MRGNRHGADRDVVVLERVDGRWGWIAWVTIANDDAVFDRGGRSSQRSDCHSHGGIKLWHVSRRHAADRSKHGLAIRSHFQQTPAAAPKPGVPLHGPVQNATVIGGAQLFDRSLRDDFLPMVALGHLARMHDQCQGPDRLNLGIPDLEVDGHRLFDLGANPASSAESLGAADHQQAGAELLRVADQHVDLFIGEGRDLIGAFASHTWDTSQDHRVVGLQFRQGTEQLVAGLSDDFDVGVTQGFDHQVEVTKFGAIFDDQHPSFSANIGVGRCAVVLAQSIVVSGSRDELRVVDVGRGLFDLIAQRKDVLARIERDRFFQQQ